MIALMSQTKLPDSSNPLSDIVGAVHFALCFAHWMTESVKDHTHIAIDGKFLQGGFKDTDSIHLVTAFASETKLTPVRDKPHCNSLILFTM